MAEQPVMGLDTSAKNTKGQLRRGRRSGIITKIHAAGDELICGTADVLQKIFASYGKVFRTGGDEFVVICTKFIQHPEELLRQMLRDAKAWSGEWVSSLSFSFGCAVGNENPGLSIDELLMIADRKMYENKRRYYEKMGLERRKH